MAQQGEPRGREPAAPDAVTAATPYGGRNFQLKLSASPVYQFEADLGEGGSCGVSRYFIRAEVDAEILDSLKLGLNFGYDLNEYDFSGSTAFAGAEPWGDAQRVRLGVGVRLAFAENWTLFGGPSVEHSMESGADWEDSVVYRGILATSLRVGRGLMLGAGVGLSSGLEEDKVFPIVMFSWKITDKLRLSNPHRAGPVGPAGLELAYTKEDGWELAFGGAYRSLRFRLDGSGIAPKGIGEEKGVPLWLRANKKLGENFELSIYAGVVFLGELAVEDEGGNRLASDDHEPAPFAALAVSASL